MLLTNCSMEIKYLLPINWQNSQTWLLFCHWRTFLVNLTRSINARCKAFAVSLVNPFTHWPWELESICLNFSVISSEKSNLPSSIASFKSFAMSIDFMLSMFHIHITNLMNLSVSSISCFPSHYVKSVCIRSLLVRIQSECRKIRTRKIPNTDTFHVMSTEVIGFSLKTFTTKCTWDPTLFLAHAYKSWLNLSTLLSIFLMFQDHEQVFCSEAVVRKCSLK